MNVNYIKVIDYVVYIFYSLNDSEVYLLVDIKCLIKILDILFLKKRAVGENKYSSHRILLLNSKSIPSSHTMYKLTASKSYLFLKSKVQISIYMPQNKIQLKFKVKFLTSWEIMKQGNLCVFKIKWWGKSTVGILTCV